MRGFLPRTDDHTLRQWGMKRRSCLNAGPRQLGVTAPHTPTLLFIHRMHWDSSPHAREDLTSKFVLLKKEKENARRQVHPHTRFGVSKDCG